MKKSLLIISLLLSTAGIMFADGLKFGAIVDYTDYLGMQTIRNDEGTTSKTDVTVRKGPWYVSSTAMGAEELYFKYDSDVVSFYTAFTFDNGDTTLSKGFVTYSVLDGLLKLRTGKYQNESFGYEINSFSNGVMGRYALSDISNAFVDYALPWENDSVYLTSVELIPDEVLPGFSALVGIPIAPYTFFPSSVTIDKSPYITLGKTLQRFRLLAKYDVPDVMTLKGYYYNAMWAYSVAKENSNLTAYGNDTTLRNLSPSTGDYEKYGIDDLFVGFENLKFADFAFKGAVDWQYDREISPTALQYVVYASAAYNLDADWSVTLDNIFTYETKDWADYNALPGTSDVYSALDKDYMITDKLYLKGSYKLDPFVLSLKLMGGFEPVSNGHLFEYGMVTSDPIVNGDHGSAFAFGANPEVRMIFGPGSLAVGVNTIFINNIGKDTDDKSYSKSVFGWSVPVNYTLAF